MLTPGKIYINAETRLRATFTDEDGDEVDPTTVSILTRDPCGTETTYVYGTDDEMQRSSTGNYLFDVTPGTAGRWFFRWVTTGTGTATAFEGSFLVQDSPFYDNDALSDYIP